MENLQVSTEKQIPINFKLNFILVVMGRLVSNLGTAIFNFALSLYVLDITKSASAFTMVISFAILPGVFVNILAGVFVDRNDKKKIIVASDILTGICVFIFMIFFKMYSTSILLFILYVIVINTIQAFFNLSINSSIPNIVSEEGTNKANSALQSVGAVINIVGPIVGAILYKTIGMEAIFLANAVSFVLSGISEMFIIFIKNAEVIEEKPQKSYIENVKEVFTYLNTQKILKFLLIIAVALNAVLNPMVLLVLQYITYNVIKITGFQLSLIESSWAIGTIVGALFVMTRKSNAPILRRFFILLEVQALLIVLWFFPRVSIFADASKWTITILFALLIFLYGMLNTIQNIPLFTHFQLKIPEELRGRVFGVLFTALNISTPIGMWVFGFALVKADWVYIPVASGILVFIVCLIENRNKHFREFTNNLED
ncbi:MAG TPA: MFS transporter [Clostridia bacterium]|nr:MFS transporter [Clostridia bacterium]